MKPRIVGLVPMRHDSERVPGKNYRAFNGRPLFHYIVGTLLDVPEINEVVIDTDSDLIARDARKHFPNRVRVVGRPPHLTAGETPMNEVLLNTIKQAPADWYLQTHSTNPLLRAETISRALGEICAETAQEDSLFSVSPLRTRLWWSATEAVNHDPSVLARTQDLPPIYEENSNLYVFTADSLRNQRSRIGKAPVMFEIDPLEAWDIDDEQDFVIAEFLHARRDQTS